MDTLLPTEQKQKIGIKEERRGETTSEFSFFFSSQHNWIDLRSATDSEKKKCSRLWIPPRNFSFPVSETCQQCPAFARPGRRAPPSVPFLNPPSKTRGQHSCKQQTGFSPSTDPYSFRERLPTDETPGPLLSFNSQFFAPTLRTDTRRPLTVLGFGPLWPRNSFSCRQSPLPNCYSPFRTLQDALPTRAPRRAYKQVLLLPFVDLQSRSLCAEHCLVPTLRDFTRFHPYLPPGCPSQPLYVGADRGPSTPFPHLMRYPVSSRRLQSCDRLCHSGVDGLLCCYWLAWAPPRLLRAVIGLRSCRHRVTRANTALEARPLAAQME